jgi:hypothetical protein
MSLKNSSYSSHEFQVEMILKINRKVLKIEKN